MTLTKRQSEILEYIRTYIDAEGFPPTRAEIAQAFEFSPNAAEGHLQALQRRGAITIKPAISRGIKVMG